jgi:hypothetical protein
MHGSGHAPPRSHPTPAALFTLRVLFVGLALFGCGLLTSAAPLRIAILRRRASDWALFGFVLVAGLVNLMVLGAYGAPPSEDPDAPIPANAFDYVCLTVLIVLSVGAAVHYLIADIRYYRRVQPRAWGPVPSVPGGRPFAQTQSQHSPQPGPYDRTTVAYDGQGAAYGYPAAQQPPQARQQPFPPQPGPSPRQPLPTAPRIDQVRAELDELSELLRKEPGERDDRGGEGGRTR